MVCRFTLLCFSFVLLSLILMIHVELDKEKTSSQLEIQDLQAANECFYRFISNFVGNCMIFCFCLEMGEQCYNSQLLTFLREGCFLAPIPKKCIFRPVVGLGLRLYTNSSGKLPRHLLELIVTWQIEVVGVSFTCGSSQWHDD